jgi:hemin uptake protein HemP
MMFSTPQPALASSPSHQARDTNSNKPSHALLSESLLRGHKTVEIVHNGSLYKLQATKLGKLILTK